MLGLHSLNAFHTFDIKNFTCISQSRFPYSTLFEMISGVGFGSFDYGN